VTCDGNGGTESVPTGSNTYAQDATITVLDDTGSHFFMIEKDRKSLETTIQTQKGPNSYKS
jgi:hypothetical protein